METFEIFWTQYQLPLQTWSLDKRRLAHKAWEVYFLHCVTPFLSCTHSTQVVKYLPGIDFKKGTVSSREARRLCSIPRVWLMSCFLGEEGCGENVKKWNESPHRIFINLTHGLLAQIEAGDSNHVTRTVYYHKITNLLRRQYNLHISSPISNCLTLIWCWKAAHSRRGSERQANQLKAFRSHNGHPPGL